MSMNDKLTVFIVDDDASVRDALGLMLGVRGYRTAVFASGEDFLSAWREDWGGCLLVDIRMAGMDGLELQRTLNERNCIIPIIIITGHGDASLARQAFKAKAHDFFEKPLEPATLIQSVEEAFALETENRKAQTRRQSSQKVLQKLTAREKEILLHVVDGKHNREIAEELGISVRTVEVHKARLMDKLGVSNVVDLVKLSIEAPSSSST